MQTEQVFPEGAQRYDTVYDAYPAPVRLSLSNLSLAHPTTCANHPLVVATWHTATAATCCVALIPSGLYYLRVKTHS